MGESTFHNNREKKKKRKKMAEEQQNEWKMAVEAEHTHRDVNIPCYIAM